ncbi:MAG: VIT domain-containing protein [Pirellulales bacterium]
MLWALRGWVSALGVVSLVVAVAVFAAGESREDAGGWALNVLPRAAASENEKPLDGGGSLADDGRIGKLIDFQGSVAVRPAGANRFTPVAEPILLQPGDWLRTDPRGANAVAARLAGGPRLTLGPGTVIELAEPRAWHVAAGELQVTTEAASPVALTGPDRSLVKVQGTAIYRVQGEKLVRVEKKPRWLEGFEGTVANESIGSLVVNVEGRNVPLTVGYHKVTVDIRDQIARTVVEQSFVNRTSGRLEGVFHFPLPQDASISGFGMWIGDELVEADVVERQRAREIYETILRERRDPALLEWSGGNLFKARVFPIEPHSEKRVKITYTQVLPLRGGAFRYSYPLESELLKQHPLRELLIDVRLHSALPLADLRCPTHLARIDRTDHAGRVEFTGREYTPGGDFEVVVEVDARQSEVVMIPHRRGDDGYFMLMLLPPGEDGAWQREVLPDGEPLELLILADTSASVDAAARRTQTELVAALLGSLTSADRFNLAGFDVECDWVFDAPATADNRNIAAARQFLDARTSLGWTDLEGAVASALEQCGPTTRVVYLGDGIPVTAASDPVAAAGRLRRMYEVADGEATFHAVSLGSRYESVVLKALASLGGGSVRQVTGEHGPAKVALDLLSEMMRPAIRDLRVEFRRLRTARVYPGELPNLAPGTQQIVLGRYLPEGEVQEGEVQEGEVVVTGTVDGRSVRFRTPVRLADAEAGNSFIPRLWARMHLDELLEQGPSPTIRDDIIALSEEYHIITPYTSLLVLETDADRERFGVKRRFQMRDGEKFFAQGRHAAHYELVQQQMRRAGNWRLGLRRNVLMELAELGRYPETLAAPGPDDGYGWKQSGGGMGGIGGMVGSESAAREFAPPRSMSEARDRSGRFSNIDMLNGLAFDRREGFEQKEMFEDRSKFHAEFDESPARERAQATPAPSEPQPSLTIDANHAGAWADEALLGAESRRLAGPADHKKRSNRRAEEFAKSGLRGAPPVGAPKPLGQSLASGRVVGYNGWNARGERRYHGHYDPRQYTRWLDTLFPALPAAPVESPVDEQPHAWPAEARKLAQGLPRLDALRGNDAGLAIERRGESVDSRTGKVIGVSETRSLISPDAWVMRTAGGSSGGASQTLVQWCDEGERGVFGRALQLGRVRDAAPTDLARPPLEVSGPLLAPLDQTYRNYTVELRPRRADRVLMVLTAPGNQDYQVRFLVDTARGVVLTMETRRDGTLADRTKFDGFVEVRDAWWATRIETTDAEGRCTSRIVQKFEPLSAEAAAERIERELAGREQVQLIDEPLPTADEAKQAVADGKAAYSDHLALVLHFAQSQQWTRVMEHLDASEELAEGKPGVRFARDAVLQVARRHEKLKTRILAEAEQLAKLRAAPETATDRLFWAEHLLGQASGVLESNEMLALLDVLRPVYDASPAHCHAMKRWMQQRVGRLQQVGRPQEALELQHELAQQYPHDHGIQQQYAQALFQAGEHAAGYAWLDRALTSGFDWQPHEEQSLRRTYVQQLQIEGRYEAMVEFLEDWLQRKPDANDPYARYLGALVRVGREEDANRLIERWLRDARRPGGLDPVAAARLQAAVNQALGQGHDLRTNRIDEQWHQPLIETALFLAEHETHASVADSIMNHHHFRQTDACREVRTVALARLEDGIGTLAPRVVQRYVGWIMPNDPAVEAKQWRALATALRARWNAAKDDATRHQLGSTLVNILSNHLPSEEHLAFLRAQLAEGPKAHAAGYARQLFHALLAQPWRQEYEDEAFTLLDRLAELHGPAGEEGAAERLVRRVADLHRLTDAMLQARFHAAVAAIESPHELSRTELREKREEALRQAREGFAARLRKEMDAREGPVVRWLNIERLYLEVQLGRELDRVADECWEILGPRPPRLLRAETPDAAERLELVLQSRCLLTLANLAARRSADPKLADRLLALIDAGLAAEPEAEAWRQLKYHLLVALDRPKELEAALREWIEPGQAVNHWRLVLGYLLAEQGKITPAIDQFETIREADELGPAEYRVLADWYMAVDRREEHERALIEVYMTAEEWELSNLLARHLQPWQRNEGEMPTELSPEVLRILAALFEKSQSPQNYLGQVRDFYRNSRDFRLLGGMADAVIGHTAGTVYPFLQGMDTVFGEVREEATVDEIVEHLAAVRRRAKNDVDRRALDLLELLVERRAAELLNQPGPHGDKALAAMRRAMDREWTPGEPRLAADLLVGLGRIAYQPLADEQVRAMESLHRGADGGTDERLHIAWCVGRTDWAYERRADAIARLEASLAEFQQARDGVLPASANNVLGTLIDYLEQERHYARGETVLREQLKRPATTQQQHWLTQRLYQLYDSAIGHEGTVSLGTGRTLYAAVERQLRAELDTDDHNHRYQLVNRLCNIYRTAKRGDLEGVGDDVTAFAFKQLPEVLAGQTNQYQSIVGTVSETLREVAEVRTALGFLIERIEQEPAWFRLNNQDGWRQFGHSLARWRTQVKELGELEPRLLRIGLAELRRELETQQSHSRYLYHRRHGYFWDEKAEDFAATAEAVLAEHRDSAAAVAYTAEYLYHGLDLCERAIEVMLAAYRRDVLDESGKARLVEYLQWRKRHAESIAILLPLVETRPENLRYRVDLMRAYFHTEQPEKLRATLQAAHQHFHAEGRWNEQAMVQLARGSLETQLYERAVEYFEEAIAHHQRSRPDRGIGQGTLSQYYQDLAQAHSGLGRTAEAVEAACGAVVGWGPRHDQRARALSQLVQVLRAAPDLDAFASDLDRQSAETGRENPLVRKTLGRVYLDKQQYAKAVAQLEIAVEVQPNDRETHEALIACHDAREDAQGAIGQMLGLLELNPRDIELYRQLGERYAQREKPVQAERAFTSIVEALPEEAESHTMLAQARQDQNRWAEAVPHWRRVAELRSLEPRGLLGLAAALVRLQRWDDAADALRKLDAQPWPSRFDDVGRKTRSLWQQVERKRSQGGSLRQTRKDGEREFP